MNNDQMEPADTHGRLNDMIPAVMEHLDRVWDQPDDGIWEIRGPRRHFTHSKVMAWVAYDRAVKIAAAPGIRLAAGGPMGRDPRRDPRPGVREGLERGEAELHPVLRVRPARLEPADAGPDGLPAARATRRIVGTVEAIQRELVVDGFVQRYSTKEGESTDGLPPGDGAFLLTTFWLADNLALIGREDEALEIFERLSGLRNDVGLFSEEYDPTAKRMLGNFPQAFSHLAHIVTAATLSMGEKGPVAQRTGTAPRAAGDR